MNKVKLITSVLTAVSILCSGIAYAKQPPRPDPASDVIRTVASAIGLSRDELNRAFFVISDYQSQKLTLPQLESLSDDQVLAKFDVHAEPYASLESEQMMLIAKRYELEVEMLAARANVDLAKFRQFYRTFDMTMTTALSLNRYVATRGDSAAKNKFLSDSAFNYFDEDDFDGPVVECDRSCQAVMEQIIDDFQDQLNIIGDMQDWENQNDQLPVGTIARIVDSETGSFLTIQKQHRSVPWAPLGGGSNCGAAACI